METQLRSRLAFRPLRRDTRHVVLLTEATRCLLRDGGNGLVNRGWFELKGISDPVPAYTLPLDLDERSRPRTDSAQAKA